MKARDPPRPREDITRSPKRLCQWLQQNGLVSFTNLKTKKHSLSASSKDHDRSRIIFELVCPAFSYFTQATSFSYFTQATSFRSGQAEPEDHGM